MTLNELSRNPQLCVIQGQRKAASCVRRRERDLMPAKSCVRERCGHARFPSRCGSGSTAYLSPAERSIVVLDSLTALWLRVPQPRRRGGQTRPTAELMEPELDRGHVGITPAGRTHSTHLPRGQSGYIEARGAGSAKRSTARASQRFAPSAQLTHSRCKR